jgi:tripartite-type tricarboxylate transporter receptor subunit TctC
VKSPRDGYTISMPSSGAAISATLNPNLPYDPLRDFAFITLLTVVPNLLISPATLAANLKEFIALAKAKPGSFNYGSGGIGATNHIATELFKIVAGVQMTHVPYKSTAQALTDVIAGQIQLVLIGPPAVVQHIQAGRLRALAVASGRRYAGLPDVPTVGEAGVPGGLDAPNWYGVVAGAGTPKLVVELLNREIVAMLNSPEMSKQMLTIGAEPRPMTPEEYAQFFRTEVAKWAKVIKQANITAE